MGQILTKQIQLNVKNSFKQLMDKVQKMDGVFDIRRCEYIENNKFLINFAYKDMVVENTGLFRTTSFARFQIIFTQVDERTIQLATEYGFIGSASDLNHATKMNHIIEEYLTKDDSNVVDAEFSDAPVETEACDFISSADKLLKAKELYDKGAISFDEYDQIKQKFMREALK